MTGPVNVTSSNVYVIVNSSTTVVDYQFTAGIGIEDEYLRKEHIKKNLPLPIIIGMLYSINLVITNVIKAYNDIPVKDQI